MNDKAEYTRKYVHGVADGDAFSRADQSLARAWNMYAKYVKHVQGHVNDHFVHIQSQQNYLISLTFRQNLNNRKSTQRIKGNGKHTNNGYNVKQMSNNIEQIKNRR